MDRIALTVDLEPDWGVRGSRAYCDVTFQFLRFLADRGMRATFFVVSDLLDVSVEPVCAIAERNEVGSHGRSHRLLSSLSEVEVGRELRESR
ncbi:MAG: polysaccharide deacetylase family protein, partial [Candidatus Brocadiaceae bacterium]